MTPPRRTLRSGGIVAPAIGRDGPNGRGNEEDSRRTAAATATVMVTAATAATAVMAMATEEEECDGCDGANPQRRLDDSILILANGILLHSIAATTVGAVVAAPHPGGGTYLVKTFAEGSLDWSSKILLSSSMIVSSLLLISMLALETVASIQQSTVVGLFSAESAAEGSTDATPPCRHDGPVHNALKLLTNCSRCRSNNVEGREDTREAWLMPRRLRKSWVDRCCHPPCL
jgi:hypothetical protein